MTTAIFLLPPSMVAMLNPRVLYFSDFAYLRCAVLQLLKSAQMQHGLRFGDYTRYRRYCTARLRRLYKSLKFTHGRGKYTKKSITVSTVTEVRKSMEPCHGGETAARWPKCTSTKLPDWSVVKAVKWATLFAELCAIKGDSRTSLEAEVGGGIDQYPDKDIDEIREEWSNYAAAFNFRCKTID